VNKLVQRKESNTPCVLDRLHGPNQIARFQLRNCRPRMRHRFGQVFRRFDRSILVMMAGLFFSVSAFSQAPGGPATPYRTSENTIQFPAKQNETPLNPQVRLIADRVAADRVPHRSDIEESRRGYLFYWIFAASPEWPFGAEGRKILGPDRSIPIRLYITNALSGLPPWVFFHEGGFVAGRFDTYDVPLLNVISGCDVVLPGYRLAPENRFVAAPEGTYAATKWMGDPATEMENPKTPLSATPPGTFGLPPIPGSPQTPSSEANRAGGNINLTTLAAHLRAGLRFRQLN
jgi:hypothetical protein